MKIVIGSDHAGFHLKKHLVEFLKKKGASVEDVGTDSDKAVDYPDYAEKVALLVQKEEGVKGILICGSGVGVSVAANKVPGVRAAICHDAYSAHQGVEHDSMNVLVLGARIIGQNLAEELVDRYTNANFTTEERHQRRLNKVQTIEKKYLKG